MNLLVSLLTPISPLVWVLIAVCAVAILAIIIIVLCARSIKRNKSAEGEDEEEVVEETSTEEQTVEETNTVTETYTEDTVEEEVEEPAEEIAVVEEKTVEKKQPVKTAETKPAQKKTEPKSAQKKEEVKTTVKKETAKPAPKKTATVTKKEEAPAKPTSKTYHISKRKDDNMWQIKAAGGARAIKLFKTQKEAIDYCKNLADNQDANIMIHKEDGSFRKLTY